MEGSSRDLIYGTLGAFVGGTEENVEELFGKYVCYISYGVFQCISNKFLSLALPSILQTLKHISNLMDRIN
jgi:hypothetical protein